MSDSVIFPNQIPNGTPNNEDEILFSATNETGATKKAKLKTLPLSDRVIEEIDFLQSDIDIHVARTDNPHNTTKSQV